MQSQRENGSDWKCLAVQSGRGYSAAFVWLHQSIIGSYGWLGDHLLFLIIPYTTQLIQNLYKHDMYRSVHGGSTCWRHHLQFIDYFQVPLSCSRQKFYDGETNIFAKSKNGACKQHWCTFIFLFFKVLVPVVDGIRMWPMDTETPREHTNWNQCNRLIWKQSIVIVLGTCPGWR